MSELHNSHPQVINRLRRAEGHLRNVIALVSDGRPCVELAQQLHAIEKAIAAAKKTLIHDHIDNCLDHAVEKNPRSARRAITELKDITKYL